MRAESARDLKQELLQDVVLPFARAASVTPARRRGITRGVPDYLRGYAESLQFALASTPATHVPDLQRSIALGVSKKGNEYALAVRVQRAGLMSSPVVEDIIGRANGEADVRMIGRVEKRSKRRRVAAWYRGTQRPLQIGVSVGHVDVTAGTLGGFVERAGKVHLLSNNHVLANEDRASRGDPILQRASLDGGTLPDDRIGFLSHAVPLKKSGSNLVDAALALIEGNIPWDANLLRGIDGGQDRRLVGIGGDFLDEGETVFKIGRTTGVTAGKVTAFDLDNVIVTYDAGNIRFDGQVEIEGVGLHAFSDGGDSGSLIVDQEMRAVALLFAGGDLGGSNGLGLTYANPIHTVLEKTRSTLVF